MPCHLSPLKNNSEKSSIIPHHLMPCHISLLKIIIKIQENHLMPHHLSLFKNNSKNLSNMPHHISPLKNSSENARKSLHPTPHFSIEK
jgi:hypothetical protein